MSRRTLQMVPTARAYDAPPVCGGLAEALIECAAPMDDERALVLGEDRLEITCALLSRGCPGVVSARVGELLPRVRADLAIATRVADFAQLEALLAQVRPALGRTGRLVLHVATCASPALVRAAPALLSAACLDNVRTRRVGAHGFIIAERATFGGRVQA